jgi:malate dehydrogenase
MVRLDQNRAMSEVANKLGVPVTEVKKLAIWGNHSATQYPDLSHAEVGGESVAAKVNDQAWIEETFIPTVQQRGKAIINARGLSSAASAANKAIDHIRDWWHGTPEGTYSSMAIPSDGSYGIPEDLIYGLPTVCKGGKPGIVQGLEIDALSRAKMDATAEELSSEADAVAELL